MESLKEKLHWKVTSNLRLDNLVPVHFINTKCGYYKYGFINLEKQFDENILTLTDGDQLLVNNDTVNVHVHTGNKFYSTTHTGGPFSLKNILQCIILNTSITLKYPSVHNLTCFNNSNIKMNGSDVVVRL